MNLPGVFLRRWNMPAHFIRTSMSSRFRSSHLVFPSLQHRQSVSFLQRAERRGIVHTVSHSMARSESPHSFFRAVLQVWLLVSTA